MPKESPPQTPLSKDWLPDFKKPEKISSVEEEVFRRLVPKFKDSRINMDEFEGVYTKEEIERDKKNIEMKKAFFENQDSPYHQRAQILEALLAEQIELSEWFGEDAMTIIPAEYDDFHHGVDLATEFQHDDTLQYLALGVDVTTSKIQIMTKLTLIKSKLEKGELTEMKYFTSERLPDFHGRMANIPSIVIGVDARTINELADLWLTIDKSKNPTTGTNSIDQEELREQAREAQKKLARHRTQVLLLKEIELQLEAFVQYVNRTKEKDSKNKKALDEALSKFETSLSLVRKILADKKISKDDERLNESDDVFLAIKANLENFF